MSLLNKMFDAMGMSEDEDFEDDDFYEDEAPAKKEPEKAKPAAKPAPKSSSKITPFGGSKRGGSPMEVCVIKPTSFDDAREIADTLLDDHAVILNMEGLDIALAQQIIHFVSGATYAMDGNLQKVSNYIFLATPPSVDISGDLQNLVDAFDFGGINTSF